MADSLAGIRLKRKRAWEQIDSLNADIEIFLACNNPRPYSAIIDFDGKTETVTARVIAIAEPDLMWGVRIGEIIHNIRSTLDHVVYELYVKSNRRSPPPGSKLQFPIFEHRSGYNSRASQYLKDLGCDATDLILSEQPFPIADGGTGEGAATSPLWHLKELNDCDKHRTIHLVGTSLEAFKFTFPPLIRPVTVGAQYLHQGGPIKHNTVLGRARFIGAKKWPFSKPEVNCQFTVNVAFDERTPTVGGWLVRATLRDIANRTDRILGRIAQKIFRTELLRVPTILTTSFPEILATCR